MGNIFLLFAVPAQPSSFEAEAELDTRIRLSWLWPVQDPITQYELQYWEDGTDSKVKTRDSIGGLILAASEPPSCGLQSSFPDQLTNSCWRPALVLLRLVDG